MAILRNVSVPNRTENLNQLGVAIGLVTLVAGAASDTLPQFPESTAIIPVLITPNAPGFLSTSYNPATGAISITSSNGADASLVLWVAIGPG